MELLDEGTTVLLPLQESAAVFPVLFVAQSQLC